MHLVSTNNATVSNVVSQTTSIIQLLPHELLGEILLQTDQKTLAACATVCSLFRRTITPDTFLARHVAKQFNYPFARTSLRDNVLFHDIETAVRVLRQLVNRLRYDPKSGNGALMEWLFQQLNSSEMNAPVCTKSKLIIRRRQQQTLLRELITDLLARDPGFWFQWRDEWILRELIIMADIELLRTAIYLRRTCPIFEGIHYWNDLLLQQAVHKGNVTVVEVLLKGMQADRQVHSIKPYVMAIVKNKQDILRLFLQNSSSSSLIRYATAASEVSTETLLHLTAFRYKQPACSVLLLSYNLVPTVQNLTNVEDDDTLRAFAQYWIGVEELCAKQATRLETSYLVGASDTMHSALQFADQIGSDLAQLVGGLMRR